MRDIMVVYAEHLAANGRPPYDETSAADRRQFEDFKGGFVAGTGETLRQVKDSCSGPMEEVQRAIVMVRSAVMIHGRN